MAIVDAYDDPNAESDLATYRLRYGIPACTTANGCFRKVNQSGGSSYPQGNASWAVEISLDLDMASAACPNCQILLVEASSNANSNLYTAENEAVALGADEISNSWGGAEEPGETSHDSSFDHPGVPITAAAGDAGYEVEYPAASQYVIAVGGTSLTQAANVRGWSETAWSGTGSGCSADEPKPTWQIDTGCARRTNDDVAAVASPETPVSVADSYKLPLEFSKPEPGWTLVGGTSVSSPLVAGTMALANAYTKSFTGAGALYKQAVQNGTGVLDDVTSGSNGRCGNYLCNAAPGFDGPTGLGSLYGAPALLPQWYKNGRMVNEGENVRTFGWGTLTLTSSEGEITCATLDAGNVWNPERAGAGLRQTSVFDPYSCRSPGCPANISVTASGLPWTSKLIEVAGVVREKTSGIDLTVKCLVPASGNQPEVVLSSSRFTGELTPSVMNGSSAAKPASEEFGSGSGELSGASGPAKFTGVYKLFGFGEEEMISADSL